MILHSVEYGADHPGDPIVLLGSIASTTDMWLPQLDTLSATRRVIALDHPGHGGSPDPDVAPGETSMADLADNVLATLDELGVDKFAVVGLSLGGALAQYLTATSGRVTRAAFLCTAPFFGGTQKWHPRSELTRAQGLEPMADGVIGLWFTSGFRASRPATTEFYRRMVTSTRGVGYAACSDALAHWAFADRMKEITVPVLTIAGAEDESTPPAALQAIADGVSGESRAEVISPAAHVPTVENPEQVNALLVQFLG